LHIGVANRGTWPLRHASPATGFVPAALCDVNPAALSSARDMTGLTPEVCFTDVDAALDFACSSGIRAVIACVPTVMHVPLAIKAIRLGLAVLIEKGMAPDWPTACELATIVRGTPGARAAVAQNYRYNAMEQAVRRAVQDESCPYHVGAAHMLEYTQYRVRPSVNTLSYPFASVWDMSCHHFDNLLYWLGPIESMTAFSWKANWSAYRYDNNTSAHIAFASGARVHYVHTHDAARNVLKVEAHGERGAIVTSGSAIEFNERPLEQFGSRPTQRFDYAPTGGEADLLRDFHAYITRGAEPGVSVINNLEVMAACEMMVRSITLGRTVRREEL
jgi:predicted dehydrogenase